MKKIIYVIVLFTSVMGAQVGIGTTNPTSILEIDATSGTLPPLELVSRATAPTGTADGQIAVINGSLFIYDLTRTKWLSCETMIYPFGLSGNSDNTYLGYASVANTNSGARILKNATIVGITAESSGGLATKGFEVQLTTGTTSFNLVANTYSNSNINIDVNANDFITVFVVAAGGTVANLTVTLHLKWRE